jgi:chitinase
MSRPARLLAVAAAAATTVAAITLVVSPAVAATNVLANPGFETGNLSSWSCSSIDTVVTGHAHSGTFALQGAANDSDNAQCTQTVAVSANTQYTLSAFVNGAYVFIGATGTGSTDPSTWTPGTSGGYSQLSLTFTTGAVSSVTVFVHGWYGQGTYFADDIALLGPGVAPSPSSSSPPPSPSASASRSASPSASPSSSPNPSPSRSSSPSPSPTTSPPSSGSLPKHFLTGYWQDFTNSAKPMRLRDVPTDFDLVAVAFADADPTRTGGVTFAVDPGLSTAVGGYTDADFINDVSTLHGRGKKVVLSVGGEKGTVSVGDSTAATNFATSIVDLMGRFGFDGVDIDLENGLNPTFMTQALRSVSARVGSRLIITLAPQTIDMQSTGGSYFQLALNIKDILTVVHTQYYNSGSMLGCDNNQAYAQGTENFLTALACIQLENGLRPDQVALGLPAGPGAAGGGVVSPSVVNAALDCLATGANCGTFRPPHTYPGIRGAMTWSVNWDASNGFNFSRTVKPHLATLP